MREDNLMKRCAQFCLAAVLIVVASSGVIAAPNRSAPLDAMLDREMRELAMPGVSAAMMDHGKLVWTGARGWADKAKGIRITKDTPFNVASLTKPMTGVVLMQLVDDGKLSLDTPMQRYDPSYKDPRVTVGHVLTMTSQADPPGDAFQYDGSVYGTLKSVVKGAAGEELGKAFSSRLFEPLGLKQTSPGSLAAASDREGLSPELIEQYESIMKRLATPYNVYGGTELVKGIPPDPQPDAAANVVSTASDYARFADAVMRGRFLKPATLKAMWTPAVTSKGEVLRYAKGWFSEVYHGHRLIYHYGLYSNAYSAVLLIVPERELVFVALSNGGALSAHNGIDPIEGNALACDVLVHFVDAKLPCKATAAASVAKWLAQIPPAPPEIASDPATLARYAGPYRRLQGDVGMVLLDQGRLWWKSPAGRFKLVQVGPDRFVMKEDNRTMTFVLDEKGQVTRADVTYPGDPNTYVLPRITKP